MNGRDDVSFSADLDFSIPANKNPANKIRQIFDNVSLNVISFLEKHRGITDVKFFERPPVTQNEIDQWEKKYYPCKLPDDYKSFLLISDGFLLKWHMKYNGEVLPLGHMNLSPLHAVKPVKFEDAEISAFNLDSNNITDGTVAFLFNNSSKNDVNPSIWFQDLSCEWNFICKTFSDYFRLMIMHFGLMNWQYAFTKVGLNPNGNMQWLRFLVPNRLNIDLRHNANASGFGWILPKNNKKNEKPEFKKRKKLNFNKIDQIVNAQLSKDNKTKIKLTLPNNSRPGSAPNNKNKLYFK